LNVGKFHKKQHFEQKAEQIALSGSHLERLSKFVDGVDRFY